MESVFPLELERMILEIAALTEPSSVSKLMLIAWRVKEWLEPLLCRVIYLPTVGSSPTQMCGFPTASAPLLELVAAKPAGVRYLYIEAGGNNSTIKDLLTACPQITDLYSHQPLGESLAAVQNLRALRRLTLDMSLLFDPGPIDFALPCLRGVTHLELIDEPFGPFGDALAQEECLDQYRNLALMPALTHLALNQADFCLSLRPLFKAALAALQSIVFLSSIMDVPAYQGDVHACSADDRFVYVGQTNFAADWFEGAKTGKDYWALADAFISARRAGKIDPSRFVVIDTDVF
ncbi:hypothetical protein C8R46DRAFT_1099522 [Mycena filopes]|nr:hypothetical protein C8R46DRAFT_1099522 [Mycena filopes]